jgi:hypothetical protein
LTAREDHGSGGFVVMQARKTGKGVKHEGEINQ